MRSSEGVIGAEYIGPPCDGQSGDLMLDVYIQGAVHRISPEAPVPVVRFGSERAVAGGAANVAANAASLGASVKLVGIAGQDENYARLMAALAPYPAIDTTGVIVTNARSTTTKTRIIGHHQQIARIDREDATEISGELELELLRRALLAINHCDLVIFSDYGKGVLTRTILEQSFAVAQKNCVRSIVDPKRRDFTVYQGASIITPNRTELALATGNPCETDDEAIAAARLAHNMCGADVLLKRSEKGMSFFPQIDPAIHLPTLGREVFDVSGAGDTVVATLGAALASNISLIESMKIANHAAGLVVGKIGTATVSRDELLGFLTSSAKMPDSDDGRLLTLDELLTIREVLAISRADRRHCKWLFRYCSSGPCVAHTTGRERLRSPRHGLEHRPIGPGPQGSGSTGSTGAGTCRCHCIIERCRSGHSLRRGDPLQAHKRFAARRSRERGELYRKGGCRGRSCSR